MNSSNYPIQNIQTRLINGSTESQKGEADFSLTFQQKFDYLNQKLDYQLKLSSEIGLRADQTRTNYIFPGTFHDFGRTRAFTPERLSRWKKFGIIMPTRTPDGSKEGFTPQKRGREIEKEIKQVSERIENFLPETTSFEKRSSHIPNGSSPSKKNIDISEKIRLIYEHLGIDMEDILDRIFDLTDSSPSNPLKKMKEKSQKSSEKILNHANEKNNSKTQKKTLSGNEIFFQKPQIWSSETKNKTDFVAKSDGTSTEILNKTKKEENSADQKISFDKKPRETEKKQSLTNFSIKENRQDFLISKQKNLISEIKMDVNEVLDCMYSKVLSEFDSINKIEKDKEKIDEGYGDIVRNELNNLYDSLFGKMKTNI